MFHSRYRYTSLKGQHWAAFAQTFCVWPSTTSPLVAIVPLLVVFSIALASFFIGRQSVRWQQQPYIDCERSVSLKLEKTPWIADSTAQWARLRDASITIGPLPKSLRTKRTRFGRACFLRTVATFHIPLSPHSDRLSQSSTSYTAWYSLPLLILLQGLQLTTNSTRTGFVTATGQSMMQPSKASRLMLMSFL